MQIGEGNLTVDITEELGGVAYVYLNAANGERLVLEARGKSEASKGDVVALTFDAAQVTYFDLKTEHRLR
jgi:lactose/L-arabinose transport system ATP-binding protein